MKWWAFLIITPLLSLFLAACNTDNVEQPQSKEAYQAELQARLDELNQQIEALKTDAEQMISEENKAELDQTVKELETQSAAITQQLQELGDASEAAWQDFKPGLEAALDDLEKAYQKARTHFEES